jgi:ZIP family zinc transporter
MNGVSQVLLYCAGAASAAILGGVVAVVWTPSPRFRSYIQHFAAGIVFAAVAVEVLPDVVHREQPFAAAVGFAVGVAALLGIRQLTERKSGRKGSDTAFILAVAVDVLIDGLLLGLGFALGETAGLLLAIALGCEFLALGLAMSAQLRQDGAGRGKTILVIGCVMLPPIVSAWAGYTFLSGFSGGVMEGVLAFAAAALLWLVVEELLVEAHEVPETPVATSLFFVGFLLLLLMDMLMKEL